MCVMKCSENPKFDIDDLISVKRQINVYRDNSVVFYLNRN